MLDNPAHGAALLQDWHTTFCNFYATVRVVMTAAETLACNPGSPTLYTAHNHRIDGLCQVAGSLIAFLDQHPQPSATTIAVRANIQELMETLREVRFEAVG